MTPHIEISSQLIKIQQEISFLGIFKTWKFQPSVICRSRSCIEIRERATNPLGSCCSRGTCVRESVDERPRRSPPACTCSASASAGMPSGCLRVSHLSDKASSFINVRRIGRIPRVPRAVPRRAVANRVNNAPFVPFASDSQVAAPVTHSLSRVIQDLDSFTYFQLTYFFLSW